MTASSISKRYFEGGIGFILFALLSLGLYAGEQVPTNDINSHLHTAPEHAGSLSLDGQSAQVSDGDTLVVKSFGADLSYDVTEIRASAGTTFTVRYDNSQSGMPHNIVFVYSESDIQPVGVASLQEGQNDYIPQDEAVREKIFAYTELARPGDIVYVTVKVPEEPGSYPYICTYPGHFTMMQGRLIVR